MRRGSGVVALGVLASFALRGQLDEAGADIGEAARLRASITNPQFESYEVFARSWAALAAGDPAGARAHAERAVAVTGYFAPLAFPLGARAALWSGDAGTARRLMEILAEASYWGLAVEADRACLGAGIAALEGRPADAVAAYREALRAYRQLGLAFDEALAAIDMATVLPTPERDAADVVAALQAARETLTRLGAAPFLARLEAVVGASTAVPPAVDRDRASSRTAGVPSAG